MIHQTLGHILISRTLLLGSLLVVLTYFSPYHPKLNNPNEGVRIYMVKAMVDQNQFHINQLMKEWGYIDDKSKKDGKLYSSKAPLMSMFGAIAYSAYRITGEALDEKELTQFCRLWANALPCFLLLLLLGWLLDLYFRDKALTNYLLLTLLISSHLLAYTLIFSGHTIAALCTAILFVLLCVPCPPKKLFLYGVLVGALSTIAVGTEYPAFLAVVPLALGFLFHQRRSFFKALMAQVIGALPFAFISGFAHHKMFGAFWKTGYSFLENKSYNKLHSQDFFGIGVPKLDILNSALFSSDVGLFFFCPFALLGVWALLRWWGNKEHRINAFFVSLSLLGMFLFISGHRGWRGGWVVGPRYITEVTAVFIILAGVLLHEKKALLKTQSFLLLFSCALCTVGILHSGIAGAFFPHLSETYKNPVYEMMLPMAFQGFSPDTWLLDLGFAPKTSAYLGIILLFLPLFLWLNANRKLMGYFPLATVFVTLWLACSLGPQLPGSNKDRVSVETRHLYRNWAPIKGRALQSSKLDDKDINAQIAIEPTKKTLHRVRHLCRPPKGAQQ